MEGTIIIAICALFVSICSTCLAAWTAFVQRRHMQLSVLPIAAIPIADYENRIGVFLQNKGLGPMRIISLRVINDKDVSKNAVVFHMPELNPGILWTNFRGSVDGATLEASERFDLLLLEGGPKNLAFAESRDRIRRSLSQLEIKVEYEDIYGRKMYPLEKKLSFFGRHKLK